MPRRRNRDAPLTLIDCLAYQCGTKFRAQVSLLTCQHMTLIRHIIAEEPPLEILALLQDSVQVSMTTMSTRYYYEERGYSALVKKKQAVERATGKHFNWSDFSLFIAGLKSVAEEQRISRIAYGKRACRDSASRDEETMMIHTSLVQD